LLTEALDELVVVTENGGRKRISKRQAAFKQLVNEAAKGNWRALKLLVDMLQDIERRTEPQTEETSFSLADEKVIAQWKARQRGKE
jgi:predicted mannosyl-3-phosphoglycerate phosphatase (HAD superfamily)